MGPQRRQSMPQARSQRESLSTGLVAWMVAAVSGWCIIGAMCTALMYEHKVIRPGYAAYDDAIVDRLNELADRVDDHVIGHNEDDDGRYR